MKTPSPYTLSLHQGDTKLISRERKQSFSVSCKRGVAWFTASGDPNDYIVAAGQEIKIDAGRDNVLLQSISGDLEVEIRPSA